MLGGPGCHSSVGEGPLRLYPVSPGVWACRIHEWASQVPVGRGEDSKCKGCDFPVGTRTRLLGGKNVSTTSRAGWPFFLHVSVLSAETDATRRGQRERPAGPDGPLVGDPIMAFTWKENIFEELDPTSDIVLSGMIKLIRKRLDAGDATEDVAGAAVLAAAGARRLGGREFCRQFLESLLTAENPGWTPSKRAAQLERLAMVVARVCLQNGVNPLTDAHLPHSAGAKSLQKKLDAKGHRNGLEGKSLAAAMETVSLYWRGLRGEHEIELDADPTF